MTLDAFVGRGAAVRAGVSVGTGVEAGASGSCGGGAVWRTTTMLWLRGERVGRGERGGPGGRGGLKAVEQACAEALDSLSFFLHSSACLHGKLEAQGRSAT